MSTEYHTSAQNINPGSFVGQYTINPNASISNTTIDDAVIQTELSAQIRDGYLPAPQLDNEGNPVTYYAVYFPHGVTVTASGASSCVVGGFCAYHGAVAAVGSKNEYFYGVHPDFQAGSGCDTGCGTGTTFESICQVSSKSLVGMMTGT